MVRNKCVILNPDNACRGTHPRRVDLLKRCRREAPGCCPCIRKGEQRSPASDNSLGLRTVVHDFVQWRRRYKRSCGSCVRMFAISYVEWVGAYRSTPPASTV